MKNLKVFFFLFSILFSTSTIYADERDFNALPIIGTQNSVTIYGSALQIGNQLLCQNSADGEECTDPGDNVPNNDVLQHAVKIDSSGPSNNSMAKLVLQSGDEVIYARLYWSARIRSTTAITPSIQIKGPGDSAYTSFDYESGKLGTRSSSQNLGFPIGNTSVIDYGASVEVTDFVKARGAGEYYVGGIPAVSAYNSYASWQLFVVVKNPARTLKNIALYDGFKGVANNDATPLVVSASGFITPVGTDPFNANLFIYSGESDNHYGDRISISDASGTYTQLVDGALTPNDVMNASVYSKEFYPSTGNRSDELPTLNLANPNFQNVLGLDIDELQINTADGLSTVLSNGQTSTNIKITSSAYAGTTDYDTFTLNMFAFETEVYVPAFCYDYTYSQGGKYLTQDNNGSEPPILDANVILNQNITVGIFLKSLIDSSLSVTNMSLDVSDINRTLVTYVTGSAKVATTAQQVPYTVSVTSGTTGGLDYINNYPIGTVNANEYFYIYYDLYPQISTISTPITVNASYNLTLNGVSVPYTLELNEGIPLCPPNITNYEITKGIFNVVHNNYYTLDTNPSGTSYNNLPTQVTKREGNFKIISLDPNNINTLKGTSTMVGVDMVDLSAYHNADAACGDLNNTISKKIWIMFDDNVTSAPFDKAAIQAAIDSTTRAPGINNTYEFYEKARKNVAFRVTYPVDVNGSSVTTETTPSGRYKLINFPDFGGDTCSEEYMAWVGKNNVQVSAVCGDNGVGTGNNGMSEDDLAECMYCIFGKSTRSVCSRDNFAIRPQALMLKFDDQNQTTGASVTRIVNDRTGVAVPNTGVVNLAAGYDYKLEVTGTNFLNNDASTGYSTVFNGIDNNITYIWTPSGVVTTGCNDTNNHDANTSSIYVSDGQGDANTTLNNVGIYILHAIDTTWTQVDASPVWHTAANHFYMGANSDCVADSSDVQIVNSAVNNGCNVSSVNDGVGTNTLKYRDYNITFHPYEFNLNGLGLSHGINHDATFDANTFIYMSDINVSSDENMSMHMNGLIRASGENNVTVTNYVDNCFAKPINITISKTNYATTTTAYRYKYHDYNSTGDENSTFSADINNTTGPIALDTTHFMKDRAGSIYSILNLNFDRNLTIPVNPQTITFNNYTIDCQDPANDCTFLADLTTKTTQGDLAKESGLTDLNKTVRHYYGRTHAPRYRYPSDVGEAFIYYEVYCDSAGDPSLLPNGVTTAESIDSINWYNNPNHVIARDGNVSSVVESRGRTNVTLTNFIEGTPSTAELTYDIPGTTPNSYPYKTTMEDAANGWLIYNKYNNAATVNEFEVEFYKPTSNWTGVHETDTTTDSNASDTTSKRIFW